MKKDFIATLICTALISLLMSWLHSGLLVEGGVIWTSFAFPVATSILALSSTSKGGRKFFFLWTGAFSMLVLMEAVFFGAQMRLAYAILWLILMACTFARAVSARASN